MSAPTVTVGFTGSRLEVLTAIHRMGVACCDYSHGGRWADRCDCKYGVATTERWPGGGEANGCPELRSLYAVIAAMSDRDWARHARRAGGTIL